MPTYRITTPDGSTYQVTAPDGATPDQVLDYAKQHAGQPKQDAAQPKREPAAVSAGSALRDIPRQIGLTARYGMEGLGQLLDVGAAPFRVATNAALGAFDQPPVGTLGAGAASLADSIGLPSPQGANERVIGDMTRTRAGAGGMVGGAAKAAVNVASPVAKNVLAMMSARPGVQMAGAVGAGGAGGSVREAGGSPMAQFVAALIGGIGSGVGANALINGANRLAATTRAAMTPQAAQVRAADQEISLTLQRAGVDWSQVPERIRQGMREEVAQALNTGQPLNPDAVRRLLVFRSTNTTPTVGQLTQDPGQITREMNLAKVGANSTDPALQRLPSLQNQNMSALLRQLDDAGARGAPDAFGAGRSAIDSIGANVAGARRNISELYSAARDSSGRSLPLEGGTFTARANALLDEANVGSFLPTDIANKMNAIAAGKYPLTVDVSEQLKTSIGNIQRGSSDGNVRRALGLVRQALDDAPLQGQQLGMGNLPAVPGTVPPSPMAAGQQSIDAFNAARTANREFMRRVEANPALQAVVDGVDPDRFVSRYVVGGGATAADFRALRSELAPEAAEAMRQHLVKHLRDAATRSTDDITKFSNDAYRTAFRAIEAKLPAFFSDAELRQLRNVGEAGKYLQAQPAGSAVNNSNSGALVLGRGVDMLDSVAKNLPFGLADILRGKIQGAQQSVVLDPRNALMLPSPRPENALRINPLLAGTVATPVEARKDNRSN